MNDKVGDMELRLNKFENFLKMNQDGMDFFKIIEQSTSKLAEQMKTELGKLQTKFYTYMSAQETSRTEQKYAIERVDRMYTRIKDDITRHETLCFEIANRFEEQHSVMTQVGDNIETLKTHALITDLHLEAYLPL